MIVTDISDPLLQLRVGVILREGPVLDTQANLGQRDRGIAVGKGPLEHGRLLLFLR